MTTKLRHYIRHRHTIALFHWLLHGIRTRSLCSVRIDGLRQTASTFGRFRCQLRRWNKSGFRTRRRSICTASHDTTAYISPASADSLVSESSRMSPRCSVLHETSTCTASRACTFHRSTIQCLESASRRTETAYGPSRSAVQQSRTSLYSCDGGSERSRKVACLQYQQPVFELVDPQLQCQ